MNHFGGQMLPQLEQNQSDCAALWLACVYMTATAWKEDFLKYSQQKSPQMEKKYKNVYSYIYVHTLYTPWLTIAV